MNAAARLVHQNVLSRHLVLTHLLTRKQITALLLSLAVLISSLSLIYITHVSRIMYAGYQRSIAEQNHLQKEHSQLLLERSALMMQSHIQQVAENKLGMALPDQKSVIVIRE